MKINEEKMKYNNDGSYQNNGYESSAKIIFWCMVAGIITIVLTVVFN
jgi:hypothetical protein